MRTRTLTLGSDTDSGLEPGLPVEEVESRLLEAARKHHLEERNIAYWLLELDRRRLYETRGFSSIGDYAMELVGIKPRKAQYLVFIASRLEKLPGIRAAFETGELSWTKAREIVSVATVETESEWLEKARVLSNRDLEREVRHHAGRGSGGFATVTISMPVEILEMWNDAYELAERLCGTELEKWQVLEPALAEFLGTHLPTVNGSGGVSTEAPGMDDEKGLPEPVRNAVLERDGWQCAFPGCTMRKTLDVHHISFRSHGGSDEPANLVCLCRSHHALVHRGICSVSGSAGVDLSFERPRLTTERLAFAKPEREAPAPIQEPAGGTDDDESWREETVAEIFGEAPGPSAKSRERELRDPFTMWIEAQKAFRLEARSRNRRARPQTSPGGGSGAHVCAGVFRARARRPRIGSRRSRSRSRSGSRPRGQPRTALGLR
jgi:HNH endonuclease